MSPATSKNGSFEHNEGGGNESEDHDEESFENGSGIKSETSYRSAFTTENNISSRKKRQVLDEAPEVELMPAQREALPK